MKLTLRGPLERDLQRWILSSIVARAGTHGWFERCNTGARNTTYKGKKGFLRYGLGNGTPDIVGCYRGHFVGLEVKRPKCKQSLEQKWWQQRHEASGGIYAVVTCPREALELLDTLEDA